MADTNYQEAVQVLQSRMGGRREVTELEGRDEMVRILKDELGYDKRRANDVIDAMIQAGTLRYHRMGAADDAAFAVPAVPTGTGGSSTGLGSAGLVGGSGVPIGAPGGYWQIGGEQTEPSNRAGQVTPSGTYSEVQKD